MTRSSALCQIADPMDIKNCVYRIDAEDRITSINRAWTHFAEANQASELSTTVLGQSLWKYVHGPEVTGVYEVLVRRVRIEYRSLSFPFRCDAPSRRRYLHMMMHPHPDGAVEFVSTVVREEARSEVALLDPTLERDETFVRMCSWCKKVQASQWVELEAAIRELELFDRPLLPRISHGICPDCMGLFQISLSSTGRVAW